MTTLSVIIPTANRAALLERAINSIVSQQFDPGRYEIIIVDNNSTDRTKEVGASFTSSHPRHTIRYLREEVPGLLSGRHRGAQDARGDILVYVDDDITAVPSWLGAIATSFQDPDVMLVGGRSLPDFEEPPPRWFRYLWATTPYGGRVLGHYSLIDLGEEACEIDPVYIFGLNFSIRREALFSLGGFHPDCIPRSLQRYQGDGETGLALKARQAGLKAVYQPKAIVFHAVSSGRLTIEYLYQRMYYEGVCTSYRELRRAGRTAMTESEPSCRSAVKRPPLATKVARGLYLLRHDPLLLGRLMAGPLLYPELRRVRKELARGYREGYRFHHESFARDRQLQDWVLRDDYFDYRLPDDSPAEASPEREG